MYARERAKNKTSIPMTTMSIVVSLLLFVLGARGWRARNATKTAHRALEDHGVRSVLLAMEYGPDSHKGSRRGREERNRNLIKVLVL